MEELIRALKFRAPFLAVCPFRFLLHDARVCARFLLREEELFLLHSGFHFGLIFARGSARGDVPASVYIQSRARFARDL